MDTNLREAFDKWWAGWLQNQTECFNPKHSALAAWKASREAALKEVLDLASPEIWEEIGVKLFDVRAAILALSQKEPSE